MSEGHLDWQHSAKEGGRPAGFREKAWSRLTKGIRKTPRIRSFLDISRMMFQLRGGLAVKCNACHNNVRLLPFGMPLRNNAMCPQCGSLERHRLLLHYLGQNSDLLKNSQILHFAPEEAIEKYIRQQNPAGYRTADIEIGRADLRISIEDTGLPQESLGIVIASHVLEHVDDAAALSELWRILRPGGVALLMVPIIEGWECTYENPAIETPSERNDHFGQEDHLRRYGRDLRRRIRDNNFQLDEFTGSHHDAFKYGFLLGETVFVARKPTENKAQSVT